MLKREKKDIQNLIEKISIFLTDEKNSTKELRKQFKVL